MLGIGGRCAYIGATGEDAERGMACMGRGGVCPGASCIPGCADDQFGGPCGAGRGEKACALPAYGCVGRGEGAIGEIGLFPPIAGGAGPPKGDAGGLICGGGAAPGAMW